MHNLRGVDVRIPRDRMTVVSGVSGSGKSTLAFDTIYAEGQRRYVESLSAYARQFLDQMQKPKVERISACRRRSPSSRRARAATPRSTVGTVTEVYDYVRALFATLGTQHCPRCDAAAGSQTVDQMVDRILSMPEGRRLLLLAPMEPVRNEGYETLLAHARQDGFTRARVDGEVRELSGDRARPPAAAPRRAGRRPRRRLGLAAGAPWPSPWSGPWRSPRGSWSSPGPTTARR